MFHAVSGRSVSLTMKILIKTEWLLIKGTFVDLVGYKICVFHESNRLGQWEWLQPYQLPEKHY